MTTWTAARCGLAAILPGCLDAVEHRHADVHQQHVRRALLGEAHGLLAVGGLAHDLDVVLGIEQGGESGPDEFLVVGQPDPDHGSLRLGRQPRPDAKPPSGRRPACSVPPRAFARSVMPGDPVAGAAGPAGRPACDRPAGTAVVVHLDDQAAVAVG